MLQATAINDVAPCGANDVVRYAHNDVMFALMCLQAHIMSAGHIISEASSFARQGKHHSTKEKGSLTTAFFFGCGGGI